MKNYAFAQRVCSIPGMCAILTLILISCQVEDVPTLDNPEETKNVIQNGHEIILGERLNNPYTLKNMEAALASLKSQGRGEDDLIEIETTHLYVRFLPADTTEVNILSQDSLLDLYDHPLDYEIEVVGDYYHDPELPEDQITWQYTVVPKDYIFPEVQYEVIDELFIAEDEEEEEGNDSGRGANNPWLALEDEAIRITGNFEELEENGRRSKFYPNGRVTVQFRNGSTNGGYEGVKGVKVRARYFVKLKSTYSGSGGYYRINSGFRNKPRYSIEWETSNYKITNSIGFSINHNGPKQKSAWNPAFAYGRTSYSWVAGTMLRAIDYYKSQATLAGLKQPTGGTNIKIRPIFDDKNSNVVNGSFRHNIPLTQIFLQNDVRFFINGDDTANIWRVMMHELGHINHILLSSSNFQQSYILDPMVVESWATAIEYYFMPLQYADRVDDIPDQSRGDIILGSPTSWQYTPLFIDLIDNTNQRQITGGNTNFADDNVSGYTLSQMQNVLRNRVSLGGVEEYLRNTYNNPSEVHMRRMLDFYADIRRNH